MIRTEAPCEASVVPITYTLNAARQNYNALIVAVKGRFTQRGFLTASYTRSTDKDNAFNYPIGTMGRRSMTRHSGSPCGPAISSRGSTTTMDFWGG